MSQIKIFIFIFLSGLPLISCQWFKSTPIRPYDADETEDVKDVLDTTFDAEPDDERIDMDIPEDDEGVADIPVEPEADPDIVDIQVDELRPEDVFVDDEAHWDGIPVCGNGVKEPGEACDDGNTDTEFCGSGPECIGDCSLALGECGDGDADFGEACDDGNTNSLDGCTTSCTANDRNIGAPCMCQDEMDNTCSNQDFTAGLEVGCENVEIPPGSGGELACLRSIDLFGWYNVYFAGGYCTIFALSCEGMGCVLIPQPGDLDTFACPPEYYEYEDVRTVMGMTITSKYCLKLCNSPADCRWNEADPFYSECGMMTCVSTPDGIATVCMDPRNFE